MHANLRIEIAEPADENSSKITIQGELDADNCLQLAGALLDLRGHVVLDLTDLSFIDSSGLSTILERRASTLASGFTFAVAGAGGHVAKVFSIAGVEELLLGSNQDRPA